MGAETRSAHFDNKRGRETRPGTQSRCIWVVSRWSRMTQSVQLGQTDLNPWQLEQRRVVIHPESNSLLRLLSTAVAQLHCPALQTGCDHNSSRGSSTQCSDSKKSPRGPGGGPALAMSEAPTWIRFTQGRHQGMMEPRVRASSTKEELLSPP